MIFVRGSASHKYWGVILYTIMTLEFKGNKESQTTPYLDWERPHSRVREIGIVHEKFVAQIPGYRKGGCIYEHFYINGMVDVRVLLGGGKSHDLETETEAYRACSEILTQIERYHRLLESNQEFAKSECSQIPNGYLSELKSYLDEAEAELGKV